MGKFVDVQGMRFGRWQVIRRAGVGAEGHVRWLCKCDCGTEREVSGRSLAKGLSVSCGCFQKEVASVNSFRHGHSWGDGKTQHSPEYTTWRAMLRRTSDENHTRNGAYLRNGITVCDRWKESFTNFLDDMGDRPIGTSLDRIDSTKGYEPGNCRWATPKEQARNMRSNRMMTLNGVTKCAVEWAEELGIAQNTIRARLHLGWSDEKTLTTPVRNAGVRAVSRFARPPSQKRKT